jgi:hypothetical protein
MTIAAKHDVIKEELREYLKVSKEKKKEILDRLEKTLRMHRKAIIRRFGVLKTRVAGINWSDKRGRSLYYTPNVTEALKYVWEISHELCAERLHPILGEYVGILKKDRMWSFSGEATGKLLAMSLGTMKTRIDRFDRIVSGGGRNMTKPSSLKEIIPVRRGPWQNPPPGFLEIDTVAHCGNTVEGEFVYTVQATDICTLWVFLESQMGKDKKGTLKSIKAMEKRSSFRWEGLDPDSGAEFINWHVKGWCDDRKIVLTRIRPGMKNDHGHIEQKNDKNVRKFAGYIRVDTEKRLTILKEMNVLLEIYINHFLPSMKCVEKVRYNITHSSRKYDVPKTPYQRILERNDISEEIKQKLKAIHQKLNPKILHDAIMKKRKELFKNAKFTRSDIL